MAKYKEGYHGGIEKYDFSLLSIARAFTLLVTPIIAFTLSLFPVIYSIFFMIKLLNLTNIVHFLFFSFFLVVDFFIFIILGTFIPGLIIKVLNLNVEEGVHEVSLKDKNFFRYLLYYVLYRPALKIIGILPLLPLRIRFLKLVGLKMGKSSVMAGTELIHDPYMVEIGEQTLIGGWSQISGHITEDKLIVKPVKIGDNCMIGAKSFIMSGVTIEDNVTLGLGSIVPKDKKLKEGGLYVGVPAKEIKKKEKN
ncbi:MAG: DapH/DapD/GlmU-related protein [Candidatus Thermoplasmatota archaeon]